MYFCIYLISERGEKESKKYKSTKNLLFPFEKGREGGINQSDARRSLPNSLIFPPADYPCRMVLTLLGSEWWHTHG